MIGALFARAIAADADHGRDRYVRSAINITIKWIETGCNLIDGYGR